MVRILAALGQCYRVWAWLLSFLQPVLLLILRVYFGWGFMKSGLGKLQNVQTTAEYFTGLGIPNPTLNVYMAGGTEFVGGLLLLVGFASRIITIPLIGTMVVAYLTAHREVFDDFWKSQNEFLKAPPFLYLLTAVLVLLFGPGALSIDRVLQFLFGRGSGARSK